MKRIAWSIGLLLLILNTNTETTKACNNIRGIWSLDRALQWAEYLVRATVVEADDANNNFVLEVKYSLKGIAPKKILVFNYDPLIPQSYSEYGYYNGCYYNGGGYFNPIGRTGYFTLRRQSDGSYIQSENIPAFTFSDSSTEEFTLNTYALVNDHPESEGEYGTTNQFELKQFKKVLVAKEQDFIKLIVDRGGHSPIVPAEDAPGYRGIPAPILIETDTNERYIVPVDGNQVVEAPANILYEKLQATRPWGRIGGCTSDDCLTFSPDKSVYAFTKDEHTLTFDYLYSVSAAPRDMAGHFVVFAPNNDALAVWNTDHVDIYRVIREGYRPNSFPKPEMITSTPLQFQGNMTRPLFERTIRWNKNSSVLVFADERGVWWFDLFRADKPRLIVPSSENEVAQILEVSDDGRFIAYSTDQKQQHWTLLDVHSGTSYTNTLITANGQRMLAINTDNSQVPRQNIREYTMQQDETWTVKWFDQDSYLIKFCKTNSGGCRGEYCPVGNFDFRSDNTTERECIPFADERQTLILNGNADYDSHLGLVAGQGNKLSFRSKLGYWIDLDLPIQSNIIKVEWMSSLYYFKDEPYPLRV
jgi:hypothetical protein